ncbi:MAG: glycosyltransferase [Magnetococcales bacterium]|nr:glycosyltransferase [Magnetococcales bacterium]
MIEISIVVICFNEVNNIRRCLESLLAQNYPVACCEIVVVDGGSRDGTPEVVAELAQRHDHVRLVTELRKGAAVARNTGMETARFPCVAFIDADCEAVPDWLLRLATYFQQYRARDAAVVAVGGGNIPPPDAADFVQAISIAMDTFVGSFNSAQGRLFQEPRDVPSLATLNVLYDKRALVAIGGFDVTLGSDAEDADINHRLGRAGHRMIYVPNLSVYHKLRATPLRWSRNMFRYGRGRARLLKRHPEMWRVAYLLPLLFLGGMSTLLLAPLFPVFWLVALYFPVLFILSGVLCRRHRRFDLWVHVFVVFLVQHFGYALGEVAGLLNPE